MRLGRLGCEKLLFPHPATIWVVNYWPIKLLWRLGVRGMFALFQYNNFTFRFFLSRPKDFFRHVPLSRQAQCRNFLTRISHGCLYETKRDNGIVLASEDAL
jgi:hypothetical protein